MKLSTQITRSVAAFGLLSGFCCGLALAQEGSGSAPKYADSGVSYDGDHLKAYVDIPGFKRVSGGDTASCAPAGSKMIVNRDDNADLMLHFTRGN